MAFLKLQVKVEFCHMLEDMTGSVCMGLRVRGGDEEVIHVDDEPSFSDHVLEGVIHKLLERGKGVAKTKEHDGRFKESFVGNEGRFPLMTILDVDVIVPPTNVKLGEVASIFQLVHKVRDEGEEVGITSGVFIEIAVVLTGVELATYPSS